MDFPIPIGLASFAGLDVTRGFPQVAPMGYTFCPKTSILDHFSGEKDDEPMNHGFGNMIYTSSKGPWLPPHGMVQKWKKNDNFKLLYFV